MFIQCQQCKTTYEVDENLITNPQMNMRCSACQNQISVSDVNSYVLGVPDKIMQFINEQKKPSAKDPLAEKKRKQQPPTKTKSPSNKNNEQTPKKTQDDNSLFTGAENYQNLKENLKDILPQDPPEEQASSDEEMTSVDLQFLGKNNEALNESFKEELSTEINDAPTILNVPNIVPPPADNFEQINDSPALSLLAKKDPANTAKTKKKTIRKTPSKTKNTPSIIGRILRTLSRIFTIIIMIIFFFFAILFALERFNVVNILPSGVKAQFRAEAQASGSSYEIKLGTELIKYVITNSIKESRAIEKSATLSDEEIDPAKIFSFPAPIKTETMSYGESRYLEITITLKNNSNKTAKAPKLLIDLLPRGDKTKIISTKKIQLNESIASNQTIEKVLMLKNVPKAVENAQVRFDN